jgi:hypothetical protein
LLLRKDFNKITVKICTVLWAKNNFGLAKITKSSRSWYSTYIGINEVFVFLAFLL